jgi:hypothetical protein
MKSKVFVRHPQDSNAWERKKKRKNCKIVDRWLKLVPLSQNIDIYFIYISSASSSTLLYQSLGKAVIFVFSARGGKYNGPKQLIDVNRAMEK